MAAPKSLIRGRLRVDRAQRAHNCQHSSRHRIQKGEPRLKVPKERSYEHYCASCAAKFIAAGISDLEGLLAELGGAPDGA